MNGETCRPINLTPYSDKSISVHDLGYNAVYEHFEPSKWVSHDPSGFLDGLQ